MRAHRSDRTGLGRRAVLELGLGGGLCALSLRGAFAEEAAPVAPPADTITAAGIATLGSLKYGPGFAHLDYVNPDAPKGGEISEWAPGGFDNYNPYTLEGRAAALSQIPQETLLDTTADTVGEAYGLLAESLEYPPSKDWVLFTLREGIRFSDGSPLTTEDVVFSYAEMRAKGLSSFRALVAQQIAGVQALDARRVRFDFVPGAPRRDIIQLAGSLPVFSKAQFARDGIDLAKAVSVPMTGSGPYMFESAKDGRAVVWKRTPDYWGKDLPLNRGRHNFDRIRIEYFGDYQSAFEGFKAGAYSFRQEASAQIWSTGYDFPALNRGQVVKRSLPNGNVASGQCFAFNLRRSQFQDIRVREALGLMFNFEWANEALFHGLYARVNSIWTNSPLAASGVPGGEELALLRPLAADLPEGILTDPAVEPPVSGKRQLDRKNMRRAAELLDAAGWGVAGDGMRRDARGAALRLEILNDSQSFDRVILPYVANLRALGVDAAMARVDDAQYENRRGRHDFDMIVATLGQEEIPGAGLEQYFGSKNTGDVFNAMGLANPAVDALIREVEEAQTQAELLPRVHALDRALRALRFWVPQWYAPGYNVAYYDMFEHPDPLPPHALGELDFWWQNAEKAAKLKADGAFGG